MLINDHRPRRIGLALALPVLVTIIAILSCSKEQPANNASPVKIRDENAMQVKFQNAKFKFLKLQVQGIDPKGKDFRPDGKEYKLQLNYKLDDSHNPDNQIKTVYIVGMNPSKIVSDHAK